MQQIEQHSCHPYVDELTTEQNINGLKHELQEVEYIVEHYKGLLNFDNNEEDKLKIVDNIEYHKELSYYIKQKIDDVLRERPKRPVGWLASALNKLDRFTI